MVPNISSARAVEKAINTVIPDIKLFFNHRYKKWVVAQIKKNPGGLILPDIGTMASSERPYVLFKVETKDGKYREPSDLDVAQAIKIGKFGNEAIRRGGDWLVDQIEAQEAAGREANKKKLRDAVSSVAPDLRKALRDR